MVDPKRVRAKFVERSGSDDGVRLFRAPGRVNLIGEHTDYNDGFVLPVAIDRDTVVAARPRNDSKITAYSVNREEEGTFDLSQSPNIPKGYWLNYIEGTARLLQRHRYASTGADIVLESDVPSGAGLSSSASLEIAVALALTSLARQPIDRKQMALACQEAEHEYTGAKIGIMDQLISAMGQNGAALLIDCRTLETEAIAIDLSDHALMICDTGVKHNLAASAYNERRRECEEAVAILKEHIPDIRALRDVTESQLQSFASFLSLTHLKRARHVITENARTLAAAEALRDRDFDRLSRLMYASHESLRDDYEVSAPELDVLVETSRKIPGVFGTRMTGGGFGGCTVSFVHRDRVEDFCDDMSEAYLARVNRDLKIYNVEIVRGAEEITD
jgi:galactokinase